MGHRVEGSILCCVGVAILGFVINGLGCASSRVADLDAYQVVPMNRVMPYPTDDELRKRAFNIVVVHRPSTEIDDATLDIPRDQVRRGLEKIALKGGASVIHPSGGDVSASVAATDFEFVVQFSKYRYASKWNEPYKFPWQSPEDVAAKPGVCHHTVEVGFEVRVVRMGMNERIEKIFVLQHTSEQENKDIDPACTISPVTLSVLFETTVDEALGCLDLPLDEILSPRGHVSAHRKVPEAERHIYRVSLGSEQGIERGDTVEIRREQRSTAPGGQESRSERVIARGRVTDQITAQTSWVAIDPTKATDEILEGDVVRPIEDESLLASLSGPNCRSIVEER